MNLLRYLLTAMIVTLTGTAGLSQLSASDPVQKSSQRVYVPVEDLDVIIEHDQQGVLIDQAEYDRLTALARVAAAKRPDPPAVPIAWTKARYQAEAVDDQLLITVRAELQQFVSGWQQVTVPMTRTAVESARLDNAPALLARGDGGSLILFTQGEGSHVLELKLSTELASLGADRSAAFGLLSTPSATFSITVPPGKSLQTGDWEIIRPAPMDQAAEYELAIGGQAALSLKLTDRGTDRASDVIVFATTGYGLAVLPGDVSWRAVTTLQVFGKPLDRLSISTPSTLEITDIDSTGLESWDIVDDPQQPGRTKITLTYRQPFEGNRKIDFRGVLTTPPETPWTVPTLEIAQISSHVGQVIVQTPAGVRLQLMESQGVRQANINQASVSETIVDSNRSTAYQQLRFDFWQPDFSLRFLTQPRQREVQTALAAVLDVNSTGINLDAVIVVKTAFSPLFDLDFTLPADWSLLSVTREGHALTWQTVSQEAGTNAWRVSLSPPLPVGGRATLQLAIRRELDKWPIDRDPIIIDLPELRLPQSNLHEGTLVIRGDDEFDLGAFEISGLDSVPLKAEFERLRYQSQDTRYSGKLKIARKPSRFSVESVAFVRLDPQTLHTFLQGQIEIHGGGIRSLKIALPESSGTSLRFVTPNGPRIIEQTAADPQDGERIWTLQFDQRIRDRFLLLVDLESPREAATAWKVPAWKFLDVDHQSGYVAVEASGEQRLVIEAQAADGAPLSEVEAIELPASSYQPLERLIAVYRSVRAGSTVTLSEQRFTKEGLPNAVCPLLAMTTVAAHSGELQHQCAFSLNLVGVQNLSLTLPEGANLWAVRLDQKPVEVRRGTQGYLIPVALDASDTEKHTLDVFYRTEGVRFDRAGVLQQTPPQLTVVTGTGTDQPVVVIQQTWVLHHPEDTLLIESEGGLEPISRLDTTGWLARCEERLLHPTWSRLGQSLLSALIAVVIAGMPVWIYQRARGFDFRMLLATVLCLLLAVAVAIWWPASHATDVASKSVPESTTTVGSSTSDDSFFDLNAEHQLFDRNGISAGSQPLENAAPADAPEPVARLKSSPQEAPQNAPLSEAEVVQRELPAVKAGEDVKDLMLGDNGVNIEPQANLPAEVDFDQSRDVLGTQKPGGLLSLSLNMAPPAGSRQKSFRYLGQLPSHQGIPLSLTWTTQKTGYTLTLFLVALGMLEAWVLRRWPVQWKLAAVLLGLGLPIGLVMLVPASWQGFLDGLFFGTIASMLIWCAVSLRHWCERHCHGCCGIKTTASLLMIGVIFSGTTLSAEEPPKIPPPEKAPVIVIPYEAGGNPTSADRILLPREKFLELWQAAHPEKIVATPVPIDGGLLEALYAGKLEIPADHPEHAVARFSARYTILSHVAGQWSVPLPLGTVAISSAKLDNSSAAIAPHEGRSLVVIPSAGLHVLDVEFSVPAILAGNSGQVTVPLQPVPTGKLTFDLPEKDLLVRINGSSSVYRRATSGDVSAVELPIDQAQELTITWQPPQQAGNRAATVHVESTTEANVHDAGITLAVGLNYRVRQGSLQDVRFAFPAEWKLQAVQGEDIGGWELQESPDGRVLRILFRRAVGDQTRVVLTLFEEQKIGETQETWNLPSVSPLDVTNETGTIAIFADEQFQVTAGTISGLSQINNTTFVPINALPEQQIHPRFAYRFVKRPLTGEFTFLRQSSQGKVAALHGSSVMSRKQMLTSRFEYQLTGAPRSVLSFLLPKNFLPLDVKADFMTDWFVDQRGDAAILNVQLAEPHLGTVNVVMTGTRPRDPNGPTVEIALPQPLDITRMESKLAIWTDGGETAAILSSDGWRALDASDVDPALQQLRTTSQIRFAFQSFELTTRPVTLQLTRGEPRLRADTLVTTTVTEFLLVHSLAVQWHIEGAAVDSLSLTTPKSLSGRLEFQGPEIRDVVESEADNDRVRWTIWFRTPITGTYFATALATLSPAVDQVASPAILCEQPVTGGTSKVIDAQRQDVLLINGSSGQLSLVDSSLVTPIQRDELSINVQQELIDQATDLVRLKTLGVAPVWSIQRFEVTESVPASVNVADLATIIARDGSYRTEVVYTMKNRRRQFLAVRLPQQAELLSVMLDNRPARCVTAEIAGSTAHLIALPKTSAADLSFPIRLVIAGQLSKPLPRDVHWSAEELEIPAPQVISQTEDSAYGIPVARTRWTVYLAEDLEIRAVTDSKRHNLTSIPEEDESLVYASAAIQELNELVDIVENTTNIRQREIAVGNLQKQLGKVQQTDLSRRKVKQQADSDRLFAQQQQAIQRFNKVQQEIQNAEQTGRVLKGKKSNQPTLNFFSQTDVYNYVDRENRAIQGANRSSSVLSSEITVDSFQLQLPQVAPPPRSKKAPVPQQESQSLTRGAFQRANEANVDELNQFIDQRNRVQDKKKESSSLDDKSEKNLAGTNLQRQDEKGRIGGMGGGGFPARRGRRMGGMGGGKAMPGLAREEIMQREPFPYQRGGLSLPVEFPTAGQKLVFTKTGGDPKLALSLRTKTTLRWSLAALWTAVWAVGIGLLLWAIYRPEAGMPLLKRTAFWALGLLGVIGWCLLPGPLSGFALILLVVATWGVLWSMARPKAI